MFSLREYNYWGDSGDTDGNYRKLKAKKTHTKKQLNHPLVLSIEMKMNTKRAWKRNRTVFHSIVTSAEKS